MNLRTCLCLITLAGGAVFAVNEAFPQEKETPREGKKDAKGKKERKEKGDRKKKEAQELDPVMEAYIKAATPNENHKALEPLAGEWETDGKFWMKPGDPPTSSKGSCHRKWIMDNRFLQEEVKGDFMGMPFRGIGLLGYDNQKKKYTTAWIDSMTTGIMTSLGTSDEARKVFTFLGEYDDPVEGKTKKQRMITRIESRDKHTLEAYETGPDGKEHKSMEIVFTRKG